MKIIYVTVLIGLLCTLCCCKNEGLYSPDELKIVSIPEIKDTLRAKKLQYSDLLPQWAFCTESYVVLIDRSDDAIIKVVDAHNDSLISAFGTKGRGRNELTHPCSDCYFDKNVKGELCMLVPTSQPCTYVVNMSASLAKGVCVVDTVYKEDGMSLSSRLFYLDGGKKNVLHKEMWFDGDASDVNNVRTPELMVLADDSIRLSAFSRLIRVDQSFAHLMYRSTCALNPIGTKFVEVYNTHNTMNIYDMVNNQVLGVQFGNEGNLDEIEGKYLNASLEKAIKELKIYNVLCCASNDYIFVTHEDNITIADSENREKFSPSLLVFDWNGNCIANFALKENLVSIAYNDVCKKLYGLDYNDNLYSYDMKDLLPLYKKKNRD